jgi:hypothetical protein
LAGTKIYHFCKDTKTILIKFCQNKVPQ